MRTSDKQALEAQMDTLVVSTINRIQNPKEDVNRIYRYRIDLKETLKRERIYDPIPEEANSLIFDICGKATYNPQIFSISLEINLLTMKFSPSQAKLFNEKMESFGKKTM